VEATQSLFHAGQHDFLLISEMPDARAASIISLAASGGGGIQDTVITQAFTTSEARELFEQAGRVAGSLQTDGRFLSWSTLCQGI
jgi:uncharacterized protein with GYD domain